MAQDSPSGKPRQAPPNDEDLAWRLQFLQLNDEDAERLRALGPVFQSYQVEFAEGFYEHLYRFPETAQFLEDPDRLTRLKALQQQHFRELLDAHWDTDYVQRRRRMGSMHAEIGLAPQLFLGAFNQYAQLCFRHFATQRGYELDGDLGWLLSLIKVIFLDVGLGLDAYFEQSTRQLREALALLGKANSELKQFAQLTSHDLKTPLATVANLCDEVVDEFGEQIPAEARTLLMSAVSRIYRMSELIDELLTAASSSQNHDAAEAIPGETLIAAACEHLRPLLEKQGIKLHIQQPLPRILGDRVRLREAIYNILSNAAKFIDKDPGEIHIRATADEDEVTLEIADNGPGIPESELDRIFVPFRRLPQHRGQPGSGLGLYFAKCIVEEQGGKIWVESHLGHGSTFFLRLPAAPA